MVKFKYIQDKDRRCKECNKEFAPEYSKQVLCGSVKCKALYTAKANSLRSKKVRQQANIVKAITLLQQEGYVIVPPTSDRRIIAEPMK